MTIIWANASTAVNHTISEQLNPTSTARRQNTTTRPFSIKLNILVFKKISVSVELVLPIEPSSPKWSSDSTCYRLLRLMPVITSGQAMTVRVVRGYWRMPRSKRKSGKWVWPRRLSRIPKPCFTSKERGIGTGTRWRHVFNVLGERMWEGSMKRLPRFKDSGGTSAKHLCTNVREIMATKCSPGGRRGGGSACWACENLWETIWT